MVRAGVTCSERVAFLDDWMDNRTIVLGSVTVAVTVAPYCDDKASAFCSRLSDDGGGNQNNQGH